MFRSSLANFSADGIAVSLQTRAALERAANLFQELVPVDVKTFAASDATFEWQAATDPSVPMLIFTSSGDNVVKPEGVRAYAELLLQAQPKRYVNLLTLKGQHMMLLHEQKKEYSEAIFDFIDQHLDLH